jgi:hypothetical protein
MGVGDKTDGAQNRINLFIPVSWTRLKAIESLLKQPIFIFPSAGITGRWTNNCDFLRRKNALAEGILTVSLLKTTTVCTARLTRKRRLSKRRTGANQSLLDQSRVSRLPKTTIRDLVRSGISCSSFLMVKTHIVGIASGASFSQRAQYSPKLRRLKVPKLSMPPFSS